MRNSDIINIFKLLIAIVSFVILCVKKIVVALWEWYVSNVRDKGAREKAYARDIYRTRKRKWYETHNPAVDGDYPSFVDWYAMYQQDKNFRVSSKCSRGKKKR